MTTRPELRAVIRIRLEDTSMTPVWTDTQIDDALRTAMIRLGTRIPAAAGWTIAIPAATQTVDLPAPVAREHIERVIDQRGSLVPESLVPGADAILTWRIRGATLMLSHPLPSDEIWTIEYRAVRTMPADDVTQIAMGEGDEVILIPLAIETLMRTRAIEEIKRGGNAASPTALADRAFAEAEREIRARRRTLRTLFQNTAAVR